MNKLSIKSGKLIFGVIIGLFFIYLFFHSAEIRQIPAILSNLNTGLLILAMILEFLFLANRGLIYFTLFKKIGIDSSLVETFHLFLASNTVNIVTPSAGLSGVFLMACQSGRYQCARSQMVLANLLFYFLDYLAISITLTAALFWMKKEGEIGSYLSIACYILSGIILFLGGLLLGIIYFRERLSRLLMFLTGTANSLLKRLKRKEIESAKTGELIGEIELLGELIKNDKSIFWQPFLLLFLGEIIEIGLLFLVFLAFGKVVSFYALFSGYAIYLLFCLVSFTPSGLGITEPLTVLAFTTSGLSLELASLAVFTFRAFSFWLPIPFGLMIMRKFTGIEGRGDD